MDWEETFEWYNHYIIVTKEYSTTSTSRVYADMKQYHSKESMFIANGKDARDKAKHWIDTERYIRDKEMEQFKHE